MPVRGAVAGGSTVRRIALVVLLATAVMVMHAISTPATSHHSRLDVKSAVAGAVNASHGSGAGHGHTPGRHPAPGPAGHLMSMTMCAFAVLISTRSVRRSSGPRHNAHFPADEPAVRLVAGPEPPVPRFAV